MPFNRKLTVMEWNAQSVRPKVPELQEVLDRLEVDIIMLNETHLRPSDTLFLAGYTIYRNDRIGRRGGGVAIGIKHHIPHKAVPHTDTTGIENISIMVSSNSFNGVFTSIYQPKHDPSFKSDIRKLTRRNAEYFIFGDFNAKNRHWNCRGSNKAGTELYQELIRGDFLIHYPTEPTHYPTHRNPSTLDILISNSNRYISQLSALNELGSDHLPVIFTVDINFETKNPNLMPEFKKADWPQFQALVNSNINLALELNTNDEIDSCIEDLTTNILRAKLTAIPHTLKPVKCLVLSDATLNLIKLRNRTRRHWQRRGLPILQAQLRMLNRRIKIVVAEEKEAHWSSLLKSFRNGSKSFWKLTKSLRGRNKNLTTPIVVNNNILVTSQEKVNAIANSFQDAHALTSNYQHPIEAEVNISIRRISRNKDANLEGSTYTSPREVGWFLRTMRPFKAPGPDKMQNILLKNLPKRAVVLLTKIFNACIRSGYFPSMWKKALVIPIPKPGKDQKMPANYRPISLLNAIGKLFEKILQRRLSEFVNENLIIPPEQFGFRSQHSTVHQLQRVLQNIHAKKRVSHSTGVVLLDIEKAFDSVWHDGLIHKLMSYNFPVYLIKLIRSFLQDRCFQVTLPGVSSTSRAIPAGVPQGSVLSPMLYNIFISDMPIPDCCEIALYADDTALISTRRNPGTLVEKLQSGFDDLTTFFTTWRIKINAAKTQAVFFPFNNKKRTFPTTQLRTNNEPIAWSKELKYLGVILDKRFTFGPHTKYVREKAQKCFLSLYPLIGRRSKLSLKNKIIIYKSIIRPILTYSTPVWHEMAASHQKQLQIMQNKCLKSIFGLDWRHPTRDLHRTTGFPLIKDYCQTLVNGFNTRCLTSDFELIRALAE